MAEEMLKRLKRACFTGHRPEKLNRSELEIKTDLETQIKECLKNGINVFISGIKTKNTPVGKETLNLGKSYEFGHSYFLFKNIKDFVPTKGINAYTITAECKKNIFNVYLRPTLKEYLRSSYDSEATIEDKLKMALNIFIGKNDSDLNSSANSTEISQPQE